MKIFEKKQKFSDRYFQGSLGPQERLWSRTIILFLNDEIVTRTIENYHLEGPESRRWASTALRFACDSQKCEKCEKSGNFKIFHFSRPDWPFIMSDDLILMHFKDYRVFTKFWDANCIFHHGQSKNSQQTGYMSCRDIDTFCWDWKIPPLCLPEAPISKSIWYVGSVKHCLHQQLSSNKW